MVQEGNNSLPDLGCRTCGRDSPPLQINYFCYGNGWDHRWLLRPLPVSRLLLQSIDHLSQRHRPRLEFLKLLQSIKIKVRLLSALRRVLPLLDEDTYKACHRQQRQLKGRNIHNYGKGGDPYCFIEANSN